MQAGLPHLHQWLHGQAQGGDDPTLLCAQRGPHLGPLRGPERDGSICAGGLDVVGCARHRGLRHHGCQGHRRDVPGHDQEVGARHAGVVEREAHLRHERRAVASSHHGWWRLGLCISLKMKPTLGLEDEPIWRAFEWHPCMPCMLRVVRPRRGRRFANSFRASSPADLGRALAVAEIESNSFQKAEGGRHRERRRGGGKRERGRASHLSVKLIICLSCLFFATLDFAARGQGRKPLLWSHSRLS